MSTKTDRRSVLRGAFAGALATLAPKTRSLIAETGHLPDPEAIPKVLDVDRPKITEAYCAIEREIRRYVRRSGGFRKELHEGDKKAAEALLLLVNRTAESGWDMRVSLDGQWCHYPPQGEWA